MDRTVNIETVTPEMAEDMLSRSDRNRPVRPARVAALARDITEGRWVLDGNPIRLNGDGSVLDGRHRLLGCVAADTPIETIVVRGLDRAAQAVMDSGSARTAGDHLKIEGEDKPVLLAAVAKLAITYERGTLTLRGKGSTLVTHREIFDWVTENRAEVGQAMANATAQARLTYTTPTVVAFSTWLLAQIDAEEAYQFWVDASERVNLPQGDPVVAMVRRFTSARLDGELLPSAAYLSAVFRAWNARRAGQTMSRMPVRGEMPVPK